MNMNNFKEKCLEFVWYMVLISTAPIWLPLILIGRLCAKLGANKKSD